MLDLSWLLIAKVVFLALTGVLAIVLAFTDLRKGEDAHKRPLTLWGKAAATGLTISVGVSIFVELMTAEDERRQAMAATAQAINTGRSSERAANKATEAAQNAGEAARVAGIAGDTARDAANSASDASERTRESSKVLSKVVGDIQGVMKEVERTSQPIARASFTLALRPPMDDPMIADYKSKFDARIQAFLGHPADQDPPQTTIGMIDGIGRGPAGGPVTWIRGRVWIIAGDEAWPSRLDATVRNAFEIHTIEIAFYNPPISPLDFEVSQLGVFSTGPPPGRIEPDLGIAQLYKVAPFMITKDVRTGEYSLETIQAIASDSATWNRNSGQVEFIADLAGAQMLINLGGIGGRLAALRSQFELTRIELLVNNRPVSIEHENVRKHQTSRGDPFWEFTFPADQAQIFRLGRRPQSN